MLRTVSDQPTLWDAILPSQLLVLPTELARVDVLLDDPVFFAPFAAHFDARIGRPSIPMETYLRLMFLKFRYRLGYEVLCREVADSISWQRFCRIPLGTRVPHPTTLMKISTRCGDDAVAALNEALLVKAAAGKLLRTDKVRADTTVVCADVGYPTDSGLLARAVGTMCRTVARIKATGAATRTPARDRRRSAGRRARAIASKLRVRGAQQRDQAQAAVRRITGELAGIAKQAMTEAAAVLRNARRALRSATGPRKGRLAQAINHLDTMVQRTQRLVAQTRSRLAGVMPESATRLVSLHDADARPIRKGRLGKPVEFGYKAQIVDNADGVILDHTVEIGNPHDAPQLAPAIERITRRTGRPPRAVTADRGYGYASVDRGLHDHGVASVAIPMRSPTRRRAPRIRTPASLPRQDQMANRIRRTNQPPQTKLRLEPHRTHRHPRRPNLVRTRRLRPQPRQDQRPVSMTRHDHPAGHNRQPHPTGSLTPNPFQVLVAMRWSCARSNRTTRS